MFRTLSGPLIESEAGQAHFRRAAALLVFISAAVVWAVRPTLVGARELEAIAGYLAYSQLWCLLVEGRISSDANRQGAALVLDHLVFASGLAVSGRVLAVLAWVPVTTSIGHGLRFGQRRGICSAIIGGVSLFCAVSWGPAWMLAPEIAVAFAATALITPIYAVRLAQTIQAQRRDTEARAAALETEVRLDALTGVLNRKGFDEAWQEAVREAQSKSLSLGLVYLDLDGFKGINDNHGHSAGDETLCRIAGLVSAAVRSTDAVARLGGDEFAVLVRSPTSAADVDQVAAKVVAAIRGQDWSGVGGQLDASAGAVFIAPGESSRAAIQEADERMLAAKRARKSARR